MKLWAQILVLFLSPTLCWAGNPLKIMPNGEPLIWDTQHTIHYKLDPQGLGRLNFDQTLRLIQRALKIWEEVEGTSIRFEYLGEETENITGQNWKKYSKPFIRTSDSTEAWPPAQDQGYLLIVIDEDGGILSEVSNANIPGSSAVNGYRGTIQDPQFIHSGVIYLNARFLDGNESDLEDFELTDMLGTIVHEVGHILGLNHTVFNHDIHDAIVEGSLDPSYARFIPTMFPSILRGFGKHQVNLHPDDIATLQWLYGNTPTLAGNVFDSAGKPVYSMVVTARDPLSPLCLAFSNATSTNCSYEPKLFTIAGREGVFSGTVCKEEDQLGYFEIPIFENSSFVLDVGEINTRYGASVISQFQLGAFPRAIPGEAELFNRNDKASENRELYDLINLEEPNLDFYLSSTEISENRLRRIDFSFFEQAPFDRTNDDYCPTDFILDMADEIGAQEIKKEEANSGTPGDGVVVLDDPGDFKNPTDGTPDSSSNDNNSGSDHDGITDISNPLDSAAGSTIAGCSVNPNARPNGMVFWFLFLLFLIPSITRIQYRTVQVRKRDGWFLLFSPPIV